MKLLVPHRNVLEFEQNIVQMFLKSVASFTTHTFSIVKLKLCERG